MPAPSPSDKVYPATKVATILDALAAEDVSPDDALVGVGLSKSQTSSFRTRVSLNQVVQCLGNADRLSRDRQFFCRAGLRLHVCSFGMFGFAILSSTNFRQAVHFSLKYQQLEAPLVELGFREENGFGKWTATPIPHPDMDSRLYRAIVEMQFGIHMSLHRDVLGPTFVPDEIHVTYDDSDDLPEYHKIFGCRVRFNQPENRFIFQAEWLDGTPTLGDEIAHAMVVDLCDRMLKEMRLNTGLAGMVRKILLVSPGRSTSFERVASELGMTVRTLRRKLAEENASFRTVVDELRRDMAIKYLRDTNLTIKEIAHALGFDEVSSFRRSFRRWTKSVPSKFRGLQRATVRQFEASAEWPQVPQL